MNAMKTMPNPNYDKVLAALIVADVAVTDSVMFGIRTGKVGGKAFMSLFNAQLVVKIGATRVQALIGEGKGTSFDPSGAGRAMKEWVVVAEPKTNVVKAWTALAEEAKAFVVAAKK
jgi:hypothetical protein